MSHDRDKTSDEADLGLETLRLILRPVRTADHGLLHALWTSAGVRRFLWDGDTIPPEQTAEIIDQSAALFAARGFGLWCAWHRADAALIGFGALWYFRDPPELELLYGVSENHWGRGYASEIAQAVIDYALTTLDMPVVNASTDVDNVSSVRVLEKLGCTFVRRAKVGSLDTVFYTRSRHQL